MGLLDPAGPAESQPSQSRGRSEVIGPEVERIHNEVRRIEAILWVLVAVTGILAVIVVVLVIR